LGGVSPLGVLVSFRCGDLAFGDSKEKRQHLGAMFNCRQHPHVVERDASSFKCSGATTLLQSDVLLSDFLPVEGSCVFELHELWLRRLLNELQSEISRFHALGIGPGDISGAVVAPDLVCPSLVISQGLESSQGIQPSSTQMPSDNVKLHGLHWDPDPVPLDRITDDGTHCEKANGEGEDLIASTKPRPYRAGTDDMRDLMNQLEEDINDNAKVHSPAFGAISAGFAWCPSCCHVTSEPEPDWCLAKIVFSPAFDWMCTLAIVCNSVFIGYSVDYAATHIDAAKHYTIEWGEMFFQVFYVMELVLKLMVFRCYFFVGHDWRWNIFDFLLVAASLYDQVMSLLFLFGFDLQMSSETSGDILFIRILKVIRMVRILRMLRVMRFFRELRLMLFSIASSMRSLFWCFVMLSLIIYIFALVFVQATIGFMSDPLLPDDTKECFDIHWGNVERAMNTLYMTLTGGEDWGVMSSCFRTTSNAYYCLFVFYTGFCIFALLNILTGIFVDNAIKHSASDRDEVILEQLCEERLFADEIKMLFRRIDSDASGRVSYEEFSSKLKDPAMLAYLNSLELSIQDSELFFRMLSEHRADREVDIDAFVDGCMRVKGPAMGVDLQTFVFAVRQYSNEQRVLLESFSDSLSSIKLFLESIHHAALAPQRQIAAPALHCTSITGEPVARCS